MSFQEADNPYRTSKYKRQSKLKGVDVMKKLWIVCFCWTVASASWAGFDLSGPQVHRPSFLRVQDLVPRGDLSRPNGPISYADKTAVEPGISIQLPDADTMGVFSDPSLFEEIQLEQPYEKRPGHFYWHNLDGFAFCHFKDLEGNDWYGWAGEDGNFNWILQAGTHYWWRDSFASLWLYYAGGSWWRADGQGKNQIQVNIDGEYYACDAQGNILEDMGQDGAGPIVSAPGRYQGDSHGGHGGHGGHHGEGHWSHNNGQPTQGSPQENGQAPSQNISFSKLGTGN